MRVSNKFTAGVFLSTLFGVAFASSPTCELVTEEEIGGLYGSWQGFLIGEFYFERPFHLQLDQGCVGAGECVLVVGFHDSVEFTYSSSGPIEFDEEGRVVMELQGSGPEMVLSAVFRRCSPISGTVRGEVFLESDPTKARMNLVGMKFRKPLFDLLSDFSDEAERALNDLEEKNHNKNQDTHDSPG